MASHRSNFEVEVHSKNSSMALSFECSPIRNGQDSGNREDIFNPCAICLDNMDKDLAALVCGHVFHHTCVTQALVRRPACPVCRRKASRQIRLYWEGGDLKNGTPCHSNRDGSSEAAFCTSRTRPPRTLSRLNQRMREMQDELDRVNEIQRMTSSHSFRLENKLVLLRQQQEQTQRQMQHIQHDLDRANAKWRRSQRIATASYAQCKETKQANVEFETKVRTITDRMLEKIRGRQRTCCPSCARQWTEMKLIALEFVTTIGASPCCQRHSRDVAMKAVGGRLTQHYHHAHDG